MYYTDEDRKRAAATRKRKQQFRQLLNSPEDTFDILEVSVPKVTHEPNLAEYGLPADVESAIALHDAKSKAEKKSNRLIIFWLAVVVPPLIAGVYWGFENILTALLLELVAGFYIYLPLYFWASEPKPDKTYLHANYERYKAQKSYYEYWQRKKDKNHWNNMTGHAFEQAVASIFRNIGFTAEVSKRGGDGGIDIILQKAGRRIAVQCKRYKSAVGPHVIRDLWGTMHYLGFDEGCIVTTTGFTKGVEEFAKDKQIYLIDLNDILKANGEDGEAYLMKKIGERVS